MITMSRCSAEHGDVSGLEVQACRMGFVSAFQTLRSVSTGDSNGLRLEIMESFLAAAQNYTHHKIAHNEKGQ